MNCSARVSASIQGHLPEALLCGATCADLGPIMRGEKEAVQVLFTSGGADLLDQFYGDGLVTSPWLAAIGSAVAEAARQLPEGRGLRILEIGAGTGGLASQVLPLIERGVHSYVFSDVSAAFFPAARQKLAAYPEVEFHTFDLEKPGNEQEFDLGSFDIILGTNVIHAVSDVRVALRHINDLLAPGGSLLFVDVATPHLWLNAVFGLTSGWWRFTDRDLRPHHPLLEREQWQKGAQRNGVQRNRVTLRPDPLPRRRKPHRPHGPQAMERACCGRRCQKRACGEVLARLCRFVRTW
jgi:SAM-dependent methyltransferase